MSEIPVEVGTLEAEPEGTEPRHVLVPQAHGGALRRGNPGNNGGRPKALVAGDLLKAATPEAARKLVHLALQGTNPENGKEIAVQDRLKAITALLDRGGVPARTEVTGADGSPFTLVVMAAKSGD